MISMTFIPIFGGEKLIPTRSARVWELAFVWEFTPIMVHISLEMEMEIGELYLALAAKSTHGRSFASKSFAGKSMASETFVSSVTEKRASGGPVVRVRCADAGTPKPRPAKGWPLIPGSKTFRVILFRQRPNRPNSCVRTDRFRQQPPLTDPLIKNSWPHGRTELPKRMQTSSQTKPP